MRAGFALMEVIIASALVGMVIVRADERRSVFADLGADDHGAPYSGD
jgi:prepilin-type N-terminal cleavage/methylation domain-containing protein